MENLNNIEMDAVGGGNLSDFTKLYSYYSSTQSFEGFVQADLVHTNPAEVERLMNYIAQQVDMGIPRSVAYADYYHL